MGTFNIQFCRSGLCVTRLKVKISIYYSPTSKKNRFRKGFLISVIYLPHCVFESEGVAFTLFESVVGILTLQSG